MDPARAGRGLPSGGPRRRPVGVASVSGVGAVLSGAGPVPFAPSGGGGRGLVSGRGGLRRRRRAVPSGLAAGCTSLRAAGPTSDREGTARGSTQADGREADSAGDERPT